MTQPVFTLLDLSAAYRSLPVNSISQDNTNSNFHQNTHRSNFRTHNSYHLFNTDHIDPPPPYSLISSPPIYSFYPNLIDTEIFRALLHFPDSHPLLSDISPTFPPRFPDSALSHIIALLPQYESRTSTTQQFHARPDATDVGFILCVRQRNPFRRVYQH